MRLRMRRSTVAWRYVEKSTPCAGFQRHEDPGDASRPRPGLECEFALAGSMIVSLVTGVRAGSRSLAFRLSLRACPPSIPSTPRSLRGSHGLSRAPTPAQAQAWPAIQAGQPCADRGAHRLGQDLRGVPRGDRPVWCAMGSRAGSPMRRGSSTSRRSRRSRTTSTAISRRRSTGSRSELRALGLPDVPIRTFVRTGDTPQSERAEHATPSAAHPGDDAGVALHPAELRIGTQHARARRARSSSTKSMRSPATSAARTWRCRWSGSKRWSSRRWCVSGLSATQKPIEEVARFLVARGDAAAYGTRRGLQKGLFERQPRRSSTVRHRRQRPRARSRSRARAAAGSARGGDVWRCVDAGLRPAGRAEPASIAPRSCS